MNWPDMIAHVSDNSRWAVNAIALGFSIFLVITAVGLVFARFAVLFREINKD